MRASECDILILPGLGGGTPEHWYARWSLKLSTARRVEQDDFNAPRLDHWSQRIEAAALSATKPVVIIAHSLGAIAAVHCAQAMPAVIGAFLVAPPSQSRLLEMPEVDPAFAEPPMTPLIFPTLLVDSRNDPYAAYTASEACAGAWGATLVDAGEAGHINPDSGHGPWPEGLLRLAHFLGTLKADV